MAADQCLNLTSNWYGKASFGIGRVNLLLGHLTSYQRVFSTCLDGFKSFFYSTSNSIRINSDLVWVPSSMDAKEGRKVKKNNGNNFLLVVRWKDFHLSGEKKKKKKKKDFSEIEIWLWWQWLSVAMGTDKWNMWRSYCACWLVLFCQPTFPFRTGRWPT